MTGFAGALVRRCAGLAGAAVLVTACAGLLLTSCAKKVTSVDPSTTPEGKASSTQLVVWEDTPIQVSSWFFKPAPPGGLKPADSLVALLEKRYAVGPGTAFGLIVDFTAASTFEVYRATPGTGFSPLKDFLVQPSKRWLDGQADASRFVDSAPVAGARYLARGQIDGAITTESPLTNVAVLGGQALDNSMRVTGIQFEVSREDTNRANILDITWTDVPNAAAYWVDLFDLNEPSDLGIKQAGVPTPLFLGRSQEFFVAYVPVPATLKRGRSVTYRVNRSGAAGEMVAIDREVVFNQVYALRISAVDVEGRFIAYTGYEDPNIPNAAGLKVADEENPSIYTFYPLSAREVILTKVPGTSGSFRGRTARAHPYTNPAALGAGHPWNGTRATRTSTAR